MASGRGKVDDRWFAPLAEAWNGLSDAQKLAREVDRQSSLPIKQLQGFDTAGGARDAGIVDQYVQPTKFLINHVEH